MPDLPRSSGRQLEFRSGGREDGDDAVNLAASAGFPHKTVIYLDIETSSPLTDSFLSYVTDWVSGCSRDTMPGSIAT